ncbi:serum amyloid P-component-like [Polyodon spathula]|uniref:serum amyloid P-component-like n=1 Tax=Polyodon spathula TaxID=7913 RepID=UPI001B7E3029|nr:serum amyloid P-component-like [Polyodon spathula]
MKKLVFLIALLRGCLGSPEDLQGKAFSFPEDSGTAHVKLTTDKEEPLEAVTVCLRYISDLTRAQSLFSLATPSQDNAFLFFIPKPGLYSPEVGQKEIGFMEVLDKKGLPGWVHACVTWESSSGMIQLWINGKGSVRKGVNRDRLLQGKPSVILGQEQDSYGGKFDKAQSFVGQISDVHMWDRALSPCEIQAANEGSSFQPGNVLNWAALQYTMHGYVLLESIVPTCNSCNTDSNNRETAC